MERLTRPQAELEIVHKLSTETLEVCSCLWAFRGKHPFCWYREQN